MDSDLKNLETDLKTSKVPQSPDDKFYEVMSTFAVEAREQCDILFQMFNKIESLYTDLAEYFAFDKSKYTVEEFLGDIKTFKDQFQQAYKDNIKIRETEEKIRRAKEAKLKAEQEKAERLARKKALVDMNAGDDTGVMDNLLEALKTGQAFHRPDQKRKRPRPTGGDLKAPLNRSRSRSNIMVLSPSSRELITDIQIDSENIKPPRNQNKRKPSRDDQADDLLRRLRDL
jgi:diaphanous 2